MVEFPQIQGPAGPQDPQSQKQDRTADADKFQLEMKRKSQRVGEIGEEQKKKRKRKDESEEEEKTAQISKMSAEAPQKDTASSSPMDFEKKKVSPLSSAQGSTTPNAPSPLVSPMPTPSAEEMQDDSAFLEESDFNVAGSAAAPQATAQAPETPAVKPAEVKEPSVSEPPPRTPETQKPSSSESSSQGQSQEKQQPSPSSKIVKKELEGIEGLAKPPPTTQKEALSQQEKELAASQLQKAQPAPPSDIQSPSMQTSEEEPKKKIKPAQEPQISPEEEAEKAVITPITPLPPSDYIEKEKKEESPISSISGLGAPTPAPADMFGPTGFATPTAGNPFANLHPHVMDLFEKMVNLMQVMTMTGETQTIVTLNAPKFATSVFFGSQIIIQEYTSAPKEFNIQINGSPQALALLQNNLGDLMASFEQPGYLFRVNRLEPGLLREKPSVRRKKSSSGEDQKGNR